MKQFFIAGKAVTAAEFAAFFRGELRRERKGREKNQKFFEELKMKEVSTNESKKDVSK